MNAIRWTALTLAWLALGWMLAEAARGWCQPEDWFQVTKIEATEGRR